MKRGFRFIIMLSVLLFLSSCGFVADGPFGYFYTESTTSVGIGPLTSGSKKGKACVKSFFGMVSIGNAGIETAMAEGGISEIFTVNKEKRENRIRPQYVHWPSNGYEYCSDAGRTESRMMKQNTCWLYRKKVRRCWLAWER